MHILVGQTILRSGHIPLYDSYSYSAQGLPWHNHEWLAQAAFALSYQCWGVLGLKLIRLLCAATMIFALAFGLKQTGASIRIQRTTLVLTAAALTTQIQFRPQLFTFAMLSIVMATLAAETYRGPAHLWPLVPMFSLWANLHGGYTIGLGALGIAAVVFTVQDMMEGVRPTRGLRLGCVTILGVVATLLNPLGIAIWTSVFHSVSNPLIRVIINDWIPLSKTVLLLWHASKIRLLELVLPVALFAAFFCSVFRAPTLDDAALTIIATIFIGAAFYMTRNLALAVIALAIPFAHHLALGPSKCARSRIDSTADRSDLHPASMTCAIAIVVLAGGVLSPRLPTWDRVPLGATSFMRQHGLHGNILNEFEWGNFLVWHLAPGSRVFVDGRAELVYPDSVLRKYAIFHYRLPGATHVLDDYRHDFILIKSETSAYRVVESDRRWKIVYEDGVAALFAPTSAPLAPTRHTRASDLIGRNYFP
jgi:hypothetical protein